MKNLITAILLILSIPVFSEEKVKMGDNALNFSLKTIQGDKVNLKDLYPESPVVLVVLRGWPEYQCPVCTRQVGGLLAEANKFAKYEATVLLVYPGPSEELLEHGKEFSEGFQFPENFYFMLDPSYIMVNKYGLRWDEPRETAYPSTYVIDKMGKVIFAKVSDSHGGRATPEEIFEALDKL